MQLHPPTNNKEKEQTPTNDHVVGVAEKDAEDDGDAVLLRIHIHRLLRAVVDDRRLAGAAASL